MEKFTINLKRLLPSSTLPMRRQEGVACVSSMTTKLRQRDIHYGYVTVLPGGTGGDACDGSDNLG